MNAAPEEFEKLQKLLTLKRHEPPPPGYFVNFSSKVIARIEAAELATPPTWWQTFLAGWQTRPALLCAYGLLVGGVSIFGLSLFEIVQGSGEENAPAPGTWPAAGSVSLATLPDTSGISHLGNPLNAGAALGLKHDPMSGPPSFLFDGSGLKTEAVNFNF